MASLVPLSPPRRPLRRRRPPSCRSAGSVTPAPPAGPPTPVPSRPLTRSRRFPRPAGGEGELEEALLQGGRGDGDAGLDRPERPAHVGGVRAGHPQGPAD